MAIKTQVIDLKDALLAVMYTQEALIKLLVRKGIIIEKELLEEIKKIKNKKSTLVIIAIVEITDLGERHGWW